MWSRDSRESRSLVDDDDDDDSASFPELRRERCLLELLPVYTELLDRWFDDEEVCELADAVLDELRVLDRVSALVLPLSRLLSTAEDEDVDDEDGAAVTTPSPRFIADGYVSEVCRRLGELNTKRGGLFHAAVVFGH